MWDSFGASPNDRSYDQQRDGYKRGRERLLKPLYAQFIAPSRITPTLILADGDHVVVECHGDATTVAGERYANTYCLVIRMAAGQLHEITEYMDTALVERVLQPPPTRM